MLRIRGPLRRDDLPGLCARVCVLLATARPGTVLCDAEAVAADVVAIEALTRLALAARGRGCELRLRAAAPELVELAGFLGLDAVLARAR